MPTAGFSGPGFHQGSLPGTSVSPTPKGPLISRRRLIDGSLARRRLLGDAGGFRSQRARGSSYVNGKKSDIVFFFCNDRLSEEGARLEFTNGYCKLQYDIA